MLGRLPADVDIFETSQAFDMKYSICKWKK